MPHAQLKYSAGLKIDPAHMLALIEKILLAHDPGAGNCKGRAYPAQIFHHNHLLVEISMLPKAHRDAAWLAKLETQLEQTLADLIPRPCWLSIDLRFSGSFYYTRELL